MIFRIFLLGALFLFLGCELDQGPDKLEYVGRYEITIPTDNLRSTYGGDIDLSRRFYELNKNQLKGSYLEVYEGGKFFLHNSLLKDSIGVWENYYNPESKGYIELKFKNSNIILHLYFDKNGYRILHVEDDFFVDPSFANQHYYEVILVYSKTDPSNGGNQEPPITGLKLPKFE